MKQDKSSRRRYETFRTLFRTHSLDTSTQNETDKEKKKRPEKAERRRYLRDYVRWLGPAPAAAAQLLMTTSGVVAGLDMAHPLFVEATSSIKVLLTTTAGVAERLTQLHLAGAAFLAVIVVGQGASVWRNYRQEVVNKQVMLSLRRALHQHLLHLPLHDLSDMKTGGIVSRLSSDVSTTAGLLQMAIVSPGVAVLRLVMVLTILFFLNWRLAASAIAIVPGSAHQLLFRAPGATDLPGHPRGREPG